MRVERLERTATAHRVVTDGGAVLTRAVVSATDGPAAERLTGVPAPRLNGLVTHWYATDDAPHAESVVVVDGRRRGPVVNAAVMTAAAPSYAPAGVHLVEVTCLLRAAGAGAGAGAAPDEATVRRQAGEMFGVDPRPWRELTRHHVPGALPAPPPPLEARQPVALGGGRFLWGDHRDTAPTEGALVSGRRAAAAVHRWLG